MKLPYIYNSRNLKALIGIALSIAVVAIYNSRNLKALIGLKEINDQLDIYNSRNLKALIGEIIQLFEQGSTIVEI